MRRRHPEWEATIDEHPLVRAADARVREVLDEVVAGLRPVTEYGAALLAWLEARRRARAEPGIPLIPSSTTPVRRSVEAVA